MANVREINNPRQTSMPYLPVEIWAMICENLENISGRHYSTNCPDCKRDSFRCSRRLRLIRKSILAFRQVSTCHLSVSWPVFGRSFFYARDFNYCPRCPVKSRPVFDHPILSQYFRQIGIRLLEECRVCSKNKNDLRDRHPHCLFGVIPCHCCVPKYPVWDPPTELDESEMNTQEVLRQIGLILELPSLKSLEFEPDDFFKKHHPKLIEDAITSIAVWKSPTGLIDRRHLTFDFAGEFPCPVPKIMHPSDQLANISTLSLDINDESDSTNFSLFQELVVAFPSLLRLSLSSMHYLPTRSEFFEGYASLKGRQKSLKRLYISSPQGLSIGGPEEFVVLIGMFPNLTTLSLAASIMWDFNNDENSWNEVFEEAVVVSKLSKVFVSLDELWYGESHLDDTSQLGTWVEFPSKSAFEDWGITPSRWYGGRLVPYPEIIDD